jgi:hypothetical protein
MKKLNVLAKLLIVLLSVIVSTTLSGCGHVTVKDKEACADLGVAGAACTTTFTSQRRNISKSNWDRERVGWICMRSNDYSDGEDAIDELCRTTNLCDYETQKKIATLKSNMQPIVRKAKAARHKAIMSSEPPLEIDARDFTPLD